MKRLEGIKQKVNRNDIKQFIYSVPVTSKPKGQSAIYRKPSNKDCLAKIPDQIQNLDDFWLMCLSKYEKNFLIQDLTFKEVDQITDRVGAWIQSNGHSLFFLFSPNSVNWTLCDIASWKYNFITVPLYDSQGSEAFDYILKITEGTLIFTTAKLFENIYHLIKKQKHKVSQICFFEEITKEEKKKLEGLGIKVCFFNEALNYQKKITKPKMHLQSQITYMFTSGTTGIPKGVVYTHKMIIYEMFGMVNLIELKPSDIFISYLPIAHILTRYCVWICIFYGANVRYAKHPITQILKDFQEIKPTFIPIVPRLLNKFYPILKEISEKQGNYNKVRDIFGGKVRFMFTGSAPVASSILDFYRKSLGVDFRQAYGQTESTGACFITYEGDFESGHVGGPLSNMQFKLIDVPQMNYFTDSNPPKGEVCFRGPTVFKEYFKDPKNTKQTVDADSWNHTGDIGVILPNGALKIIDRKKNIFKLQQGIYVAPQKIENIYCRCRFVAEAFLYGDSMKDYNVAIIYPNQENLPFVTKQLGIQETDLKKICQNPKVNKFIYDQLTKQALNDGLLGFEHAKRIKLWHQPFQIVGLVTNTMKIQRHLGKQLFKKQIQDLYSQGEKN